MLTIDMSKKKKTSSTIIEKESVAAPKAIQTNAFMERFATQTIWHWALLVLVPFFVYIKISGFQFIEFDDVSIIRNNFQMIGNIRNILWAFKTDAFISLHGDFYRPMQTVIFMLDAFIGGEKPLYYHLSGLLIHILTVLSLYNLLKALGIRNLTSLLVSLIFSVHPLLSAAVSWVPAMGDLLLGLFGIQLFLSFIRYRQHFRIIDLILCALFFLLALFSKETAVLLPLLLLFYYWYVAGEKINIKRVLPLSILWIAFFVFYYILRSKVVTGHPPDFILGLAPFQNNLPTIPIIIAKFLIPVNLSTMPLFEPIFTTIGCLLLIIFSILLITYIKKKEWLPVMGFVWFLMFIIPPMFFKLFFSKFLVEYYEHRMYLPLAGLIVFLAWFFDNYLYKKSIQIYYWLPVGVIALFSFMALIRSDDFKSSISFFTNATNRGNPGACNKRGELYYNDRDFTNALSDFEKAIELSDNEYPPAFFNHGRIKAEREKDHTTAERDFTNTILLDSSFIDAYISRAGERIFLQNFPGAFQDIDKAKHIDSSNSKVYETLGKIYVNSSDFNKAEQAFTRTINLDSGNAEAFNDRAYVRYRKQDFNNALVDCNHALALFPQFLNAYYNKGMIYMELKKPEIAIKTFDTTLALTNNFYFGYFYRGMAKKQINDMKGACDDWQQSVNLGFSMAQDTINKYCVKQK